jgi:hypothetical protein
MHFIAILVLSVMAAAANPIPSAPAVQKPAVELSLSGTKAIVVDVTVRNNTREPIVLSYFDSPFELFTLEIRGQNGKRVVIADKVPADAKKPTWTVTAPPGGIATMSLEACHHLAEIGGPQERYTFVARAVINGVAVESAPVTVGP